MDSKRDPVAEPQAMTPFAPPSLPPGHYRHYGGGDYTVFCVGRNSTNKDDGRPMVAYFSRTTGNFCFRDYEEFVEPTAWPDGVTRPRFCRADQILQSDGISHT
jgi:hypothetical protein